METITLLQEREKNALKNENELKSPDQPLYRQVIDTFPPNEDSIWDEIDLLGGDQRARNMLKIFLPQLLWMIVLSLVNLQM